jgi:aminoglycoside phosphotransferase (APT) family kinase protein
MDASTLLVRLRSHLADDGIDYLENPRRLMKGMTAEVWTFALRGAPKPWSGPLVIRLLPKWTKPEQPRLEAAVQDALAGCGFPVPEVLLVDDRGVALGGMFVVTQRCPGRPVLRGQKAARFAAALPKLLTRWPTTITSVALRLHRCKTETVMAHAESRGIDSALLSVQRHLTFIAECLPSSRSGGRPACQWLSDHQPSLPERPSIIHGDLWPANVLMRGSELTGVVDWERAVIGDPALEVGFAKVGFSLLPAPAQVLPPIREGVAAAVVSISNRIEALYNRVTALDPDVVRYYEAVRCALELATVIDGRAHLGQASAVGGWENGIRALSKHFERITGIEVQL